MTEERAELTFVNSNDFPNVSCFVSDPEQIPDDSIQLLVPYDYDVITAGVGLKEIEFNNMIRKVEEKMLQSIISDLFHCEIMQDRRLQELDYLNQMLISGLDYKPVDYTLSGSECMGTSLTLLDSLEGDSFTCTPMKGSLSLALTHSGDKVRDDIKEDLLVFIKDGMDNDKYVSESAVSNNYGIIKTAFMESRSEEPDFIATTVKPDDNTASTNDGTQVGTNNGSNDDGPLLDAVEIAAIILGFLLLLLFLLFCFCCRKKKEKKMIGEENSASTENDLDLQDVSSISSTENVEVEVTKDKNRADMGGLFSFIPVYGTGKSLGDRCSTHNVHKCRSQTCEACKANLTFVKTGAQKNPAYEV